MSDEAQKRLAAIVARSEQCWDEFFSDVDLRFTELAKDLPAVAEQLRRMCQQCFWAGYMARVEDELNGVEP